MCTQVVTADLSKEEQNIRDFISEDKEASFYKRNILLHIRPSIIYYL